MAVTYASRFAVLKLEDDDVVDDTVSKDSGSNNNFTPVGKNKSNTFKGNAPVGENKTKSKKKKKSANDAAQLQNLAFETGLNKVKTKSGSHATAVARPASQKQWEEWKKKDSEFVSEVYEQDLQQALLLSKIDYEEKKEVYEAIQKEAEQTKQSNHSQKKKKKNNQKKEKGSMSLDEFQNLPSPYSESYSKEKADALDNFEIHEKIVHASETNFFEKIEEDVEKIIHNEQKQESFNKKREQFEVSQPVQESALSLQFQEEMRKKDEEINLLRETVEKLQEELKIVKTRNKRLCGILGTGEMKEKAEILIQIEQLTSVKDELTDQLHEFHAALEQERSKVHSLQTELKKCQSSKKERRDSK